MAIYRRMMDYGSQLKKTAHDFAARLAIVPMVLEARGLDVTPDMITLMESQGDDKNSINVTDYS